MKNKKSVVLASVYHDPGARLLYLLDSEIPNLKKLYENMVIAVSPATSKKSIRKLLNPKINVLVMKRNWRGYSYRRAMKVVYSLGF